MFCPQCATENDADKSYCRQCGQPLAAVRLALEGRVDEAIKTVEGDKRLSGHRLRIGIAGFLILIAVATLLTGGKIGFANIQSGALILILITAYFIYFSRKHHHVARLLDTEDQSSTPKLNSSPRGQGQLGEPNIVAPGSITEQNTLELKRDNKAPR